MKLLGDGELRENLKTGNLYRIMGLSDAMLLV